MHRSRDAVQYILSELYSVNSVCNAIFANDMV